MFTSYSLFLHRTNTRIFSLIVLFTLFAPMQSSYVSANLPVINRNGENTSPFALIYEKVAPTVVRIDVKGEIPSSDQNQGDIRQFFNGIPQQQQNRPVEGMGSGIIIDRKGYVITNNHVVDKAQKITVKVNEDETYDAEVVGTDPETDLAVIKLKLDGKLLPEEYVAELGDSDELKPGDYAIAIGNPIGLERTINVGVISAIGRYGFNVMGTESPQFQNYIQTDAQINPGNSGGALVDINGKVIGINDMYTARYAGIGFAIPVNMAKGVSKQLIEHGEVKRGFVGIKPDIITSDIQEAMNLPEKDGVLIREVLPDTPAEKAGLKHGDVIVKLDGKKVKNFQDLLFRIAGHAPGEQIEISIFREGTEQTFKLKLAERKSV
ncbi:MAG: trypsin-like peptidase domain-containing protein [Candidatus Latescibacteria bacterium]|nr:trypsin-like peptidase domain-containing protein [Candidatus Latescibacterota bacterium]